MSWWVESVRKLRWQENELGASCEFDKDRRDAYRNRLQSLRDVWSRVDVEAAVEARAIPWMR